jgi:hypothetical protein
MLVSIRSEHRLLESKAQLLASENRVLAEEIQILKHRLFGRKSEQLSEEQRRQLYLFNEAEAQGEEPAVEPEPTVVTAHTRTKKRGRKPLPERRSNARRTRLPRRSEPRAWPSAGSFPFPTREPLRLETTLYPRCSRRVRRACARGGPAPRMAGSCGCPQPPGNAVRQVPRESLKIPTPRADP